MTRGESLSSSGGWQFNLHSVICPGLRHREPRVRTGLMCLQLKRPGPSGPDPHTGLAKTGNRGGWAKENIPVRPLLKDGGVRLSTKAFQIASWTHLQEKNIFKETNETPNGEQLLEKEERPKGPILWTWAFGNIRLIEPPSSSIPFFLYKVADHSDKFQNAEKSLSKLVQTNKTPAELWCLDFRWRRLKCPHTFARKVKGHRQKQRGRKRVTRRTDPVSTLGRQGFGSKASTRKPEVGAGQSL